MTNRIFVYVVHQSGVPADSVPELRAAAQQIDAQSKPTAIVTGSGPELDAVCEKLRPSFDEIWKVSKAMLAYPNAELIRQALLTVLPPASILLVAHNHLGVDLSPGLSIKMNAAYLPDTVAIERREGSVLHAVRQEFGGQVSTRVRCDLSSGAVLNIRPGAFKPLDGAATNGAVIDKSSAIGTLTARRRYIEVVAAEAGNVDITKHNVLVSVGRGIQDSENIAIAEELAQELGGAVSCSRPVADAKWLDKSRQVGSSGKTVKPKVYLACGISGQFQHMVGLQGNPFIVAINKNPNAPIFRLADVGIVDDVLEFLPVLTEMIREQAPLAMHKGSSL